MRLVLSRARLEDFDQIAALCLKAFEGQDLVRAFFGHGDPTSLAHTKKFMLAGTTTDPADVFLKIEDEDVDVEIDVLNDKGNATGEKHRGKRIVCASNWKIYPTYVTPAEEKAIDEKDKTDGVTEKPGAHLTYLETEQEREDALSIVEDVMGRRMREHTEPHVLCYMLFTDPEYQKKGCGRAMMQWGNNVADSLMVACWIEASMFGEKLYEQVGYVGKKRVEKLTKSFSTGYYHMRRPPQTTKARLEGGNTVYMKYR